MRSQCVVSLAAVTILALGSTVSVASASEAGLLYLSGEAGTVTFGAGGLVATFTGAAGTISCTSTNISWISEQTSLHVTSGVGSATFFNCKETKGETKLACYAEGFPKDRIVFEFLFGLFNALALATKTLEPGFGMSVRAWGKSEPLKIRCGAVALVEIQGTVLGLITEATLTADLTTATIHFVNQGEICDTEDSYCKKAQEKHNELLGNFTGVYEKLTLETNMSGLLNKMMLVDD